MNKMFSKWSTLLSTVALLLLFGACNTPVIDSGAWPEMKTESKPWTRWWWLGNAVDSANIKYNLEALAKAGIGGVEITPLYGVKGYEDQFIDYLSPRWMNMLNYTIEVAHELGMKVDMVQGTGWPFGGPQVTPEHAASKLIVQEYTLPKGKSLAEKIVVQEQKQEGLAKLEAVLVYNAHKYIADITEHVAEDGTLDYTAADDGVTLYAVFCGKTRQQVKRSAPGGAGYTLDHYSKEALMEYVKPFDTTVCKSQSGLRALFNDSYEVYGTTWTPDFMEKFKEFRGYDLRPYVRYLAMDEKDSEIAKRVLCDYRETISDLLLNEFLIPWKEWSHEKGYVIKNQSHGSPGNLLDLYGTADIPECETFGSTPFEIEGLRRDSIDVRAVDPDPVMLKFASSGANVYGRQLVSSESFTWLREHFRGALSHCKPEVEQLWLSGVNHVFFHGTTYSPKDDPWPGWKFYASMNIHPNNPIWHDAPAMFDYIARCQSVLQNSYSDNDFLIYWPIYDAYSENGHGELFMQFGVHDIDDWLHPTDFYKLSNRLTKEGFNYDFVSDSGIDLLKNDGEMIHSNGESEYKAIILPKCKRMPVATFERVLALADLGATVVLQDFPTDVPGIYNVGERRKKLQTLVDEVKAVMENQGSNVVNWGDGKLLIGFDVEELLHNNEMYGEQFDQFGLKFLRKRTQNGYYYYVVNHSNKAVNAYVPLNVELQSAYLLDPQTGKTGQIPVKTEGGKSEVYLQLKSGQSIFISTSIFDGESIAWNYYEPSGEEIPVTGEWKVKFIDGGPELPAAFTTSTLESWTAWGEAYERFSGTAVYTTTFDLPETLGDNYQLNLGDVRESVEVRINGKDAGTLWSNPYKINIGEFVQPGKNTLELEVTNLGANRIRDLDIKGVNWKKFYNTNVVTVAYKPFDASIWGAVPSGLLGPISLEPLTEINN